MTVTLELTDAEASRVRQLVKGGADIGAGIDRSVYAKLSADDLMPSGVVESDGGEVAAARERDAVDEVANPQNDEEGRAAQPVEEGGLEAEESAEVDLGSPVEPTEGGVGDEQVAEHDA